MIAILYFTVFAIIAGSAFALMYANIKSINLEMNKPNPPSHPEAPNPGEEVMYVDVSQLSGKQFVEQKERLEDLFKK
tara:strand:- start:47 stop:277 length:231 start_codon:yes stop_codon:yes gene_type:complete